MKILPTAAILSCVTGIAYQRGYLQEAEPYVDQAKSQVVKLKRELRPHYYGAKAKLVVVNQKITTLRDKLNEREEKKEWTEEDLEKRHEWASKVVNKDSDDVHLTSIKR